MPSVVIITGALGLIGSEAASYFGKSGFDIAGIDNDMRQYFFGREGSTAWNLRRVTEILGKKFRHYDVDIRDAEAINKIFIGYGSEIALVIHAAAQPSHDWAAKEPLTDFTVNANGTSNLLEATRRHAPEAVFIFNSTNKVYGDRPNTLSFVEQTTRWELEDNHRYYQGIPEEMSVDQSLHSLFGVSKLAADVLVQEYGRYFGMRTVSFRGGVLTGPQHSGTQLHGFLAYLMKCAMSGTPYTIIGYMGKQVRDIIHCNDVIRAFDRFFKNPRSGEVYNLGGGRKSNISVLEAIEMAQEITGKKMQTSYNDTHRIGDHIWYVSDLKKFKTHYPGWDLSFGSVRDIAQEMYELNRNRWFQ